MNDPEVIKTAKQKKSEEFFTRKKRAKKKRPATALKPIKDYARKLRNLAEHTERLSALSGSIGDELQKLEVSEAGGCLYFGGFHPAAALTRLAQEIADELRQGLESMLWDSGLESIANSWGSGTSEEAILEEIDLEEPLVEVRREKAK